MKANEQIEPFLFAAIVSLFINWKSVIVLVLEKMRILLT